MKIIFNENYKLLTFYILLMHVIEYYFYVHFYLQCTK